MQVNPTGITMTSVQDRSKLKRVPYDTWSTREQLCLAACVFNSGENVQNWKNVSESLKPFAEKAALRPSDWFSPKSCSVQYSHLLENADNPKRKKRDSGESLAESIVHRLTQERIAELKQILAFQRDEYQQLKVEVNLLKCGPLSDDKMQKMWQAIEQEECEQEQKARAHAVWLAKRQQKQDSMISQTIALHTKQGENATDNHDVLSTDSSNKDEDEKKRGGRSPLLTSLLKSTSPTTQIQTPPIPVQASSPTIASLLVSSPKVPSSQLDHGSTQNVSSQLQQLVSTAIASVTSERPSAVAPTLSMLLELPANSQRGPLLNLQTSAAVSQPNTSPEIRTPVATTNPTESQNGGQIAQSSFLPVPVSPNIPVTESMVQIIDHIDEVIGKDIMADVIDKDEINEIIGDIEELIKEDITPSPRTKELAAVTTAVVESPLLPPLQDTIRERPEPRNVDEPVSMSDSPESEMAIEEIDSSTSNIAKIIGTVAVEPTELKIEASCESPKVDEKLLTKPSYEEEIENTDTECSSKEAQDVVSVKDVSTTNSELSPKIDKELEDKDSTQTAPIEVEKIATQQLNEDEPDEEALQEETEAIEDEENTTCDVTGKETDNFKESEIKENLVMEQLEIHLAEITGDVEDKPDNMAAANELLEATNDVSSAEDTEKSQDISLILEDDETSQSSLNKDKPLPQEIAADILDSSESCPGEYNISTEEETEPEVAVEVEGVVIVEDESTAESTDSTPVAAKVEDKDISKDSISVTVHQVNVEDEETNEADGTDAEPSPIVEATEVIKEEHLNEPESVSIDDSIVKKVENDVTVEETVETQRVEESETKIEEVAIDIRKVENEVKDEIPDVKVEIKEASVPEVIVKKETALGICEDGDLDEEESSLSKLSGGRTMKTYSKKQAVTIDSEPENEGSGEGADYRTWKKAVMLVFNRLVTHKYASVFLRPITEDQAPGYHSVIFRPMDLSTIKKNIDNGTIRSTMHFQRDVMLMFQNAIMYNKQDTFVYKMAVSMQEECLQHMQILVQVTGEGPFRRETRTAASSSSDLGESSTKPQRKRSHITPSPHDSDSPRTKKRRKSEND